MNYFLPILPNQLVLCSTLEWTCIGSYGCSISILLPGSHLTSFGGIIYPLQPWWGCKLGILFSVHLTQTSQLVNCSLDLQRDTQTEKINAVCTARAALIPVLIPLLHPNLVLQLLVCSVSTCCPSNILYFCLSKQSCFLLFANPN